MFIPVVASAINENCGERDASIHSSCKSLKYEALPSSLKKFMAKMKCDVKTGSNYDYGYEVDLNLDGKPEYTFCCQESGHGPCGMTIFGKTTGGKWKAFYDYMHGFSDGKTACFGFVVLKQKHSGYNDICIDDGVRGVITFKNGKYIDLVK
jgi:hypothetical protein